MHTCEIPSYGIEQKAQLFSAEHSVSKYYSRLMILYQENLNDKQHCRYIFGEYAMAHDNSVPSNTKAPRALNYIYLQSTLGQTGYNFLHLQTNSVHQTGGGS